MSYVALYRKYRPHTFADVVAQDHIVRTLGNALKQERLSHAYLLAGPRGTGKTTVARILAKAINCETRAAKGDVEPCNSCSSCVAVTEGHDLDILEIDAASNRGIDEIRDLREKVRYAPARSPYKVYIVDEVHMLTNEAFNAFLKTLEDPPAHCVFIFATTDPQRLPATILSRCQRFDFRQVPPQAIIQRLMEVCRAEGCTAHPQALLMMARHARGGMRDALALLDQAHVLAAGEEITPALLTEILGVADESTLIQLTGAALSGDIASGLGLIHRLFQEGRDPRQFLRDWLEHLRNLLIMNTVGAQGASKLIVTDEDSLAKLKEQARQFTGDQLLKAVTYLSERDQVIRWAPDGRIVLESAWLHFTALIGTDTASPRAKSEPASRESYRPPARQDPPETPSAALRDNGSAAEGRSAELSPRHEEQSAAEKTDPANAKADGQLPAAGPPKLAQLKQNWHEICGQVRQQEPLLAVYLQKGEPVQLAGRRLTISYSHEDYEGQRMAQAERYRRLTAKVLEAIFGVPFEINIVLGAGEKLEPPMEVVRKQDSSGLAAEQPPASLSRPVEGANSAGRRERPSTDEFVQEALQLLNARVVDVNPRRETAHQLHPRRDGQ